MTQPANNGINVAVDQNVVVVFSESMNTVLTPTLTQTEDMDPLEWSFSGWPTIHFPGDTATWSHNKWNGADSIILRVYNYYDLSRNSSGFYSWSYDMILVII